MSLSSSDPVLAPPPEHFGALFPFHLVLDHSLQLLQAGPVLQRYLPSDWQGRHVNDVLTARRPSLKTIELDRLLDAQDRLWTCEAGSGLLLRGNWQAFDDALFFLCTAWLPNLDTFENLKLTFRDIPLHDSCTDHLILIRQQQFALAETQQLSGQLRMQKDKAEAASRAKSTFLTNMSHEIRTPMNGILGMTEILLDSDVNHQHRELAQTIKSSANHLLSVINDILDLAQFEAGHLKIQVEPNQPAELFSQAVRICDWSIEQKQIEVQQHCELANDEWFALDGVRIAQVLVNLIGNAVKFTDMGGRISLRCYAKDDRLRMEVEDNGCGMENPEHMFQAFSQADSQASHRVEGTGLGLAICEKIINASGGEIGATSELGGGSTIWFELPMVATESPTNVIASSAELEQVVGHVLLVEDNPVNQQVARAHLRKFGLQVSIAVNGLEAVSCVRENSYDLILMDCQMPEMDGYQATRELRDLGVTTPIVALTADVLEESRQACLSAGMDDVLTKPILRNDLQAQIATWLKV